MIRGIEKKAKDRNSPGRVSVYRGGRRKNVILTQILGALLLLAGSALVLFTVWEADQAQTETASARPREDDDALRKAA